MDVLLPVVIGLAVVALVAARSVVVVPRDSAFVVERLGRYARSLSPGVHVVAPGLEAVRQRHTLAEVTVPLGPTPCVTLDNRAVTIDGTLRLAVRDARAATYEVADHVQASVKAARSALRDAVGRRRHEDVRTARSSLAGQVGERARRVAIGWGVDITACEITAIDDAR